MAGRMVRGAVTLVCAVLLLTGCGRLSQMEYINMEQAQNIALAALQLEGEDISYLETVLRERDGHEYYDVTLVVDDITQVLHIDALTGVIIQDHAYTGTYVDTDNAGGAADETAAPETEATVSGEDVLHEAATEGTLDDWTPPQSPNETVRIGAEESFSIAVAQAGLQTDEVTLLYATLNDSRNAPQDTRQEYDVYFRSEYGINYHVEVDATDGTVLSMERARRKHRLRMPNHDADGEVTLPSEAMGEDRAIAIALNRARLYAEDVTVLACEPDLDGATYEYDILIRVNETSMYYTFEIDAVLGTVIRWSRDAKLFGEASAEEARAIVLTQIRGATVHDIVSFETNMEDGRLLYIGCVVYYGMEYHFEIDAYSGAIRKWVTEPVT